MLLLMWVVVIRLICRLFCELVMVVVGLVVFYCDLMVFGLGCLVCYFLNSVVLCKVF